jgi:uncharacterized protein YjiS (DUF1127 family)
MSSRPLSLTSFPASLPPVSRLLVTLALMVARWDDRSRSRQSLSRLDAHLIRDIGLDAAEAAEETAKPFWRD